MRSILIWKDFLDAVLCVTEKVHIYADVYTHTHICKCTEKMSRRIYTKLSPVVTGENGNETGERVKGVFIFT